MSEAFQLTCVTISNVREVAIIDVVLKLRSEPLVELASCGVGSEAFRGELRLRLDGHMRCHDGS